MVEGSAARETALLPALWIVPPPGASPGREEQVSQDWDCLAADEGEGFRSR